MYLLFRNPNKPVEISANDVEWPQFTTQTSSFLEINSQSMRVITAPNRERLHKLTTHLFSARRRQFSVDIPAKQGKNMGIVTLNMFDKFKCSKCAASFRNTSH